VSPSPSDALANLAFRMFSRRDFHDASGAGYCAELQRLFPPKMRVPILARKDSALEGVQIPRGSLVVVMVGAANADPDVFTDANIFDYERKSQENRLQVHSDILSRLEDLELRVAFQFLSSGNWELVESERLGEEGAGRFGFRKMMLKQGPVLKAA
jgi:cytochrome P450